MRRWRRRLRKSPNRNERPDAPQEVNAMDAKLVRLELCGCGVKAALPRFLNDQGFMLECVAQVLDDPAFEELGRDIEAGKAQEAFDAAHALKGITANTALTPLYAITAAAVEPLRRGSTEGLGKMYDELMRKRAELKKALED